jgi:hypothetical protein
MKKILKLTFLFTLFLGCSKNSDDGLNDDLNDNTLLTIEILSDFYTENTELTRTGHVYLTDSEGALIKDTNLLNNSSYTLTSDFDYENNPYDITFESKWVSDVGETSYLFNTYIDVSPIEIAKGHYIDPNPNEESAKIILTNVGDISFGNSIDSFSMNNSFSMSCSGVGNDTQCDLSIRLKKVPDNVYTSFRKLDENSRRYLWVESVSEQTRDTFEYTDIPFLTESVNIDYPSGYIYAETEFFGFLSDDTNTFYKLSDENSTTGTEQTKHFFPQGIFDGYKINTLYRNDDANFYSSSKESSIPGSFTLPNLDLQIISEEASAYQAQTSGNFSYYSVYFTYLNPDDDLFIQWRIYGKNQETIMLSLSQLTQILLEEEANFSTSDLDLFYTRLYNVEGISTYRDIIQHIEDSQSEAGKQVELLEYMEKR